MVEHVKLIEAFAYGVLILFVVCIALIWFMKYVLHKKIIVQQKEIIDNVVFNKKEHMFGLLQHKIKIENGVYVKRLLYITIMYIGMLILFLADNSKSTAMLILFQVAVPCMLLWEILFQFRRVRDMVRIILLNCDTIHLISIDKKTVEQMFEKVSKYLPEDKQ